MPNPPKGSDGARCANEAFEHRWTVLMYAGRVGTVTAAAALALRPRQNLFRCPEERPIVG
jgi:hypothetical protein